MKSSRTLRIALLLLAVTAPAVLLAVDDIPLTNWTVPPYSASGASGGITTMGDITADVGFIGVTPCRLVDTRPESAFPAGYGTPALSAGAPRNFDLNNHPTCTGIPADVEAYSLNVTVTLAAAPGHLVIYPQGGAQPSVSSINYVPGQTIANAVIVPAGTAGGITVVAASATHLLIDINGYFSSTLNQGNSFSVFGNNPQFTIIGLPFPGWMGQFNNAATSWSYALQAFSASTAHGGAAINAGATGGSGFTFGVRAYTNSTGFDAAGVKGIGGSGDPLGDTGDCSACHEAGVRGTSFFGFGVLGISEASLANVGAVSGIYLDSNEVQQTYGILGYSSATAIYGSGNIVKTGTVSFVEPHPSDASKVIQYASLEGPEAGTYFRGRGKFQNGTAVINVPEYFRMVTDSEGLSIQVTPIGAMATVAVMQIDLDRIVVNGSRNVEFFYTVNGVRRSERNFQPIRNNDKEFIPAKQGETIPASYNAEFRSRLISNGTYRPDGTINMETARRLGWDKIWAQRDRPQPQPVPDTP